MRTILLISIINLIIINQLSSQKGRPYYKKGRATIYDVTIRTDDDLSPYYHCVLITNNGKKVYKPTDISEYRARGDYKYISYNHNTKQVFLKVVEEGLWSLMTYVDSMRQSKYFIKIQDGAIREIKPGDIQNLGDYWITRCLGLKSTLLEITTLELESLRRLVKGHNKCSEPYLPKKKWQLFLGMDYPRLLIANSRNVESGVPLGVLRFFEYGHDYSFRFRFEHERPIKSSTTYLILGLQGRYMSFNESLIVGTSFFFVDNTLFDSGLSIGVKQKLQTRPLRMTFFINAIPSYSFAKEVRLLSDLDQSIFMGQIPSTNRAESPFGIAGNLGVGAEYDVTKNQSIQFTIGYQHRFSVGDNHIFNITGPYAELGFSF